MNEQLKQFSQSLHSYMQSVDKQSVSILNNLHQQCFELAKDKVEQFISCMEYNDQEISKIKNRFNFNIAKSHEFYEQCLEENQQDCQKKVWLGLTNNQKEFLGSLKQI